MTKVIDLDDRHKSEVLQIVREVHGDETADLQDRHWRWRIDGHPHFDPAESYRLGYEVEGAVRGIIAIIPARVKIGDQILPCLCPVDLVVSPDLKQRGAAGAALTISREVARRKTPVIYGNTDDRNVKLWGRVFDCEPVVGRYRNLFRFLRIGPKLRERGVPAWAAFAADIAYRALSGATGAVLALRAARDVKIERVTQFGQDFDELWKRAAPGFANVLVRNSCFLDWRFGRIPHRDYKIFAARRDGALVGYIAMRPIEEGEQTCLRIVDLFFQREDVGTFRRLLRVALREARAIGATRVSMLEVFQPELRRLLKTALFVPGTWTVNINGRCLGAEREEFYDAARWWITFADSDLDLVA